MSAILPDVEFEKFETLITRFMDLLKSLEMELNAYKAGAFVFVQSQPETKPERTTHDDWKQAQWRLFQTAVELAKRTPAQRAIAEKYDAALAQWKQQSRQSGLEEVASEWLRTWKPTDTAN